jgi:hypothetical protein
MHGWSPSNIHYPDYIVTFVSHYSQPQNDCRRTKRVSQKDRKGFKLLEAAIKI